MKSWKIVLFAGTFLGGVVPNPTPASICAGPQAFASGIQAIAIVDGNLVVEMRWSSLIPVGTTATIEVLDRGSAVVASQGVLALPGEITDHSLSLDQTFFERHGYWYEVQVLGSGGLPLAPPAPALVSFCPQGSGCTYSVVEGVATEAVAMGKELFDVLDGLEATGSADLLQDALMLRPDLDHQIYWVADQLDRLQRIPFAPDCACLWYTEYELTPEDQSFSYISGSTPPDLDYPDWEEFSTEGAGANFQRAGQLLGGPARELSSSVQGRAGLHLRCRSAPSWTPLMWAGVPVAMPTLVPCQRSCWDATVRITATAESITAANAAATEDDGGRSTTSAVVDLFLNDLPLPVLTASALAEADRQPGDPSMALVGDTSGVQKGEWWMLGGRASATLQGEGRVEICLQENAAATDCTGSYPRPDHDDGPWAYGCASVSSSADLVGIASCALWPIQRVSLWPGLFLRADLLILPWKP